MIIRQWMFSFIACFSAAQYRSPVFRLSIHSFAHLFVSMSLNIHSCQSTLEGNLITWAASSEFGTYRLCEQRRFRRACASAQSRQNLHYSLIQAVSQEEPSDGKPDPWPLWMAGHAQLKFVMTECSKTQIHLTGLTCKLSATVFISSDPYTCTLIQKEYKNL